MMGSPATTLPGAAFSPNVSQPLDRELGVYVHAGAWESWDSAL